MDVNAEYYSERRSCDFYYKEMVMIGDYVSEEKREIYIVEMASDSSFLCFNHHYYVCESA